MAACAVCAHPVPSGARFCSSCGAPVHASAGSNEERRVVTVLFADLVGYTGLAEHLDPEWVKRLIESCFERLVADIEAFGGRVDKLLGDGILALFGAPIAHEDDAERAVRAGLRMQQTLARFVEERNDPSTDIQMRIGINTGEVLVGMIAGTEYTAMGDTVNMASRLQTMAPRGGVLIGSATAALCTSNISLEPFGTNEIRGRQQLEQAYVVTGAAAAGSRVVRCDVPFVGRTHERALLDAAVDLVRAGHSAVVSVVGEAGSGKTRLVDQVLTALDGDAILLELACAPYGESTVWGPLSTGMGSLFDVGPDASADELRTSVEARADALWGLAPGDDELERFITAITHLRGLPSELDAMDPVGARDRLAGLIADMMRRHAQTKTTVLWVDNLQWAEPALLDLFAVVVRSLSDLPFMLVTAHRPDDALAWPPPELERPLVLRVPLRLFDRSESTALVRAVLDRDNPDGGFRERTVSDVVDRGGGNPLFLVELAALAATCPVDADLPGSLRALIAARLDQLPSAQRAIIDNAAILGTGDSVRSLARFAEAMQQDFHLADLDDLLEGGLLDGDHRWWRFRSEVVREVAYQTLTKRVRAQRHAGVAAVLRGKDSALDDHAYHAAAAAELIAELGPVEMVPSSITSEAVEALYSAAQQAMAAGRSEHVQRLVTQALDLLAPGDESTARRLLLLRATAELDQRQFGLAHHDAQLALDSALHDGDLRGEGEARRRIGTAAHMHGDLDSARRELDTSVALFRRLDDGAALADSLRARGFAEVFGGSLVEARRYLDEAQQLYAALGDERGNAWTHHNLAWVAFQAGDHVRAETLLEAACERFEALGDRVGVNWAQGLRAFVTYFRRRFDEAEELATAVAAEAKRWGDVWAQHMMQTLLANLRLWTGHLAEAEQLAERALAGFRESDDRYGVMTSLAPLSRARAGLGKVTEALRGSEESIALGRSFGELGLALQGAAAVAVHIGDGDQALLLSEQVLERHRTTGSADDEALVVRALALCQLGRAEEALATIDGVDVDDFPFGLAARALVRALSGDAAGAMADADGLGSVRGASYFDTALALLGAVLAAVRSGDHDEHRRRLGTFATHAGESGDVVFIGIANALGASVHVPTATPVALRPGWRRIVEAAPVPG